MITIEGASEGMLPFSFLVRGGAFIRTRLETQTNQNQNEELPHATGARVEKKW